MQPQDYRATTADPSEYIALLRRRWWILLLVPLLTAAAVYYIATPKQPVYKAKAILLVDQGSTSGNISGSDVQAMRFLSRMYSDLLTSRPILEPVIAKLGLHDDVGSLQKRISVKEKANSPLIDLTTTHTDPKLAAAITNQTSRELIRWVSELQSKVSNQSSSALEKTVADALKNLEDTTQQLAAARAKPDASEAEIARLETLRQQYELTYTGLYQLQQRADIESLESQRRVLVVEDALAPGYPTGSPSKIFAILGFMVALGATGVVLVLYERVSDRVRIPDDISREVALPILTSLPQSRHGTVIETILAPQSATTEAIRSLRARLQFAADDTEMGAVVVTSPGTNEGKSIIAANLAVAFAQVGHRVVLVDGNLRHPRQHELFGETSSTGLSNLLIERQMRSDEVLVRGPVPGLMLLLAGPRINQSSEMIMNGQLTTEKGGIKMDFVSSPAELLTGERLTEIVSELRLTSDVVIIDAPPVLGLSDSMLLAAVSDYAVIVAAAGRTRPEMLRKAAENLKSTGVHVLGVVLNGVKGHD